VTVFRATKNLVVICRANLLYENLVNQFRSTPFDESLTKRAKTRKKDTGKERKDRERERGKKLEVEKELERGHLDLNCVLLALTISCCFA